MASTGFLSLANFCFQKRYGCFGGFHRVFGDGLVGGVWVGQGLARP